MCGEHTVRFVARCVGYFRRVVAGAPETETRTGARVGEQVHPAARDILRAPRHRRRGTYRLIASPVNLRMLVYLVIYDSG